LSFEGRFPCSQAWRFSIKNEVISFIPDTPSTNHKNFHEEGLSKIQFGRLYLLVNIYMSIPSDTQRKPSASCRVTVKEKMFN
jgi:hypothetical protein